MPRFFLDSSALLKRYHVEAGSTDVDALFDDSKNRLLISELALVEVRSSVARKVREGTVSSANYRSMIALLDADVSRRRLKVAAVATRRLAGASALFGVQGLSHNLRTLDAIHLATAMALHARTRLTAFVAADRKLLAVAELACGLNVMVVG